MIEYLKAFSKDTWVAIALAFLAPTLIWLYLQKETHELQVSVRASIPVVSLNDTYSDGVEFYYQNEKVSSLDVVDIEVTNTGNTPIRSGDFEKPLELIYYGSVLGEPKIITQQPAALVVDAIITDDGRIRIEPLLLNSNDSFLIRAYISEKSPKEIDVAGRIVGVKNIVVSTSESDDKNIWISPFLGAVLGYFLFGAIKIFRAVWKLKTFKSKVRILLKPMGIVTEQDVRSEATAELASRLEIDNHDSKTNMLLVRLKIEKLLRKIYNKNHGTNNSLRIFSSGKLLNILEKDGIINQDVLTTLKDILPILNKEIHDHENYLTSSELDSIVDLGVDVIGNLETISQSQ